METSSERGADWAGGASSIDLVGCGAESFGGSGVVETGWVETGWVETGWVETGSDADGDPVAGLGSEPLGAGGATGS